MHPVTNLRFAPVLPVLLAAALSALPGCVVSRNVSGTALQPGAEATISGRVVAMDTDPWAYDGNAIIQVATDDARLLVDRDGGLDAPRGKAARILLYLMERDAAVGLLRSG